MGKASVSLYRDHQLMPNLVYRIEPDSHPEKKRNITGATYVYPELIARSDNELESASRHTFDHYTVFELNA